MISIGVIGLQENVLQEAVCRIPEMLSFCSRPAHVKNFRNVSRTTAESAISSQNEIPRYTITHNAGIGYVVLPVL